MHTKARCKTRRLRAGFVDCDEYACEVNSSVESRRSGGLVMLNRRDAMMRLGQLGVGAMALPRLLQAESARADTSLSPSQRAGRAKSCILLYLWGGPPQQDMWDMKPHTPQGIRSIF